MTAAFPINWPNIIVGAAVNLPLGALMMLLHPGSLFNQNPDEPSYDTQVFINAGLTGDGGDVPGVGSIGGYAPDVEIYDMYGYRPAEGQKGKIIRGGEFYEYNLRHWPSNGGKGPSTRPPEYISLFSCTPPLTATITCYT
jgi:hypothetical protein